MADLAVMSVEERIDRKDCVSIYEHMSPEQQRAWFYTGKGMLLGSVCLSKEVEEKEDGRKE